MQTSWWALAPLLAIVLAVAVGPSVVPRLWHRAPARLALLLALCAPAAVRQWQQDASRLGHAVQEYLAFVLLLLALYTLAAGIVLQAPLSGRPRGNLVLLATGAVLANLLGTTGACMLLLPVLLRANAARAHRTHLVVFFIFLVGNVGGLLTPLGDPPLFLGFLRGVPFFWTLRLWPAFVLSVGVLLAWLSILERRAFLRESHAVRRAALAPTTRGVRVQGIGHAVGFVGVVALLVLGPALGLPAIITTLVLAGVSALAYGLATEHAHRVNRFDWAPMAEVAVLFLPLFLAMPQALEVLNAHHTALPLAHPEAFYWWTGALSALLDNAPCYLSMAAVAAAQQGLGPDDLRALSQSPQGAALLAACAHGAVSMGAMTYIGNGPNLMVRQSAVAAGVRMPGFVGYIGWALVFLLPTLIVTRLVCQALGGI